MVFGRSRPMAMNASQVFTGVTKEPRDASLKPRVAVHQGAQRGRDPLGQGALGQPRMHHLEGLIVGQAPSPQGGELTVYYEGARPKGYSPMKKQGALILGIGGDNSDRGVGTFFEGVVARGFTSDATDAAIQKDIVAARYGK